MVILIEFKFVVFFLCLFVGVPVGVVLASRFKMIERFLYFMCVFFTVRMNETINFISREFYRGTSRGFEITLVDLLVLTLFGYLVLNKKLKDFIIFPKGFLLYSIFLFLSVCSCFNSDNYLYSSFEVLKLIRMGFFFWVMCNYIDTEEKLQGMILNILLALSYIFLVVLYDKYVLHTFQAKGPFPHQNSMVMYTIVFGSVIFACTLFTSFKKNLFNLIVTLMSVIIVISSLSRAGMFFFLLSLGIIYSIKVLSQPAIRDFFTFLIGSFFLSLILLKASDSIIERFKTAPKESQEVRIMLAEAALKMSKENILGVGLNNFGLKINYPYPYSKGTPHYYDEDFRGGLVETAYLMVAAESGWPTLVIYVLFLFRMLVLNLVMYFKSRDAIIKMLSLGVFGGLVGIYLESSLEWVLRQTTNFYQLMLIFALINSFNYINKKLSQNSTIR